MSENVSFQSDLRLAVPGIAPVVAADGRSATDDFDASLSVVAQALREAKAPCLAGLMGMTLEATEAAVRVAQQVGAMLLPACTHTTPEAARQRVSQHGTIDAACEAELIVWVGCNGETSAITQRIASRQLRGAFVAADLPTVLNLRATYRADPAAEPLGTYQRVVVVLAPDTEPRVVSQWHRLAAEVQTHTRVSVLQLPCDVATSARGCDEVITWLTGVSPSARGGVWLSGDQAAACPGLQRVLDTQATDFVLWLGAAGDVDLGERCALIGEAWTNDVKAVSHIELPTLAVGQAGAVMRCDGAVLALNAGESELPDALNEALARLLAHLTRDR